MKEVFLDFDENDNPVISVKGAKGPACKTLTRELEKALGQVTNSTPTSEMKEREVATNVNRASNKR